VPEEDSFLTFLFLLVRITRSYYVYRIRNIVLIICKITVELISDGGTNLDLCLKYADRQTDSAFSV
jgi:hypothetical protein